MAESNRVDRNLLFGLLCLINDLVDKKSLIDGVRSWLADSSRSLDQILIDQGALKPEDCDFILPLVEKHIQRHAGDPGRSLAALSSISTVVNDLRELHDPQIAGTLDLISRTGVPTSGTGTSSLSMGPSSTGFSSSRFRVVRYNVGEGGLGIVSCATDNDFVRDVAVKQIKPRWADDPQERARFLHEAEVTGLLEHPGVVPVYGLGTDELGRPFYAMKFIPGEATTDELTGKKQKAPGDTLWHAIKRFHAITGGQDRLGLQLLLRRLVDVCNAVHFAHKRGVLHRDLKPGNIMLGEYGETLVVDWGLARMMRRNTPDAQFEQHWINPPSAQNLGPDPKKPLGTYEFMSPEQAAGDVEHLGVATDIYSLGATLYCILTGEHAFSRKNQNVLGNIKAGRFERPSAKKPDVPKALEAVCLKAMALRPEDRYASARDLATDIEKWMADDPVSAWKEPITVRARRWMKRHPKSVSATAATLIIGLVASIVANNLIARQRDRAEQNFKQAIQTVQDYLVSVGQNELFNEPRLKEVRQRLLDKAKANFDDLAKEPGNGADVRYYRALANYNLGLLAAESATTWNDVTAKYRTAIDLLERKSPDRMNEDELVLLSKAYTSLARFCDEHPELQAEAKEHENVETSDDHGDDAAIARNAYQKAVAMRQSLNGRYPSSAEYWRLSASAHMNLAQFETRLLQARSDTLAQQERERRWSLANQEFSAAGVAIDRALNLANNDPIVSAEARRTAAKVLFNQAQMLADAAAPSNDASANRELALKKLDESSMILGRLLETDRANLSEWRDVVAERAQCDLFAYMLANDAQRLPAAIRAKDDLLELLQDYDWATAYTQNLVWARGLLEESAVVIARDPQAEARCQLAKDYAKKLAEAAESELLAKNEARAKDVLQRSISVLIDAVTLENDAQLAESLIEDFVLYSKGLLKQWPHDKQLNTFLTKSIQILLGNPRVQHDRFVEIEKQLHDTRK